MEALVKDFKQDMRDNDFGDQLVRSIASALMPADSDSASLLIAAISCTFSSVVNDWSSLSGHASPPPDVDTWWLEVV